MCSFSSSSRARLVRGRGSPVRWCARRLGHPLRSSHSASPASTAPARHGRTRARTRHRGTRARPGALAPLTYRPAHEPTTAPRMLRLYVTTSPCGRLRGRRAGESGIGHGPRAGARAGPGPGHGTWRGASGAADAPRGAPGACAVVSAPSGVVGDAAPERPVPIGASRAPLSPSVPLAAHPCPGASTQPPAVRARRGAGRARHALGRRGRFALGRGRLAVRGRVVRFVRCGTLCRKSRAERGDLGGSGS